MLARSILVQMLRSFRGRGRRQRIGDDVLALELRPAHLKSSQSGKGLTVVFGAPWALAAPHQVTARPPRATISELRPGRSTSLWNDLAFYFRARRRDLPAIPMP